MIFINRGKLFNGSYNSAATMNAVKSQILVAGFQRLIKVYERKINNESKRNCWYDKIKDCGRGIPARCTECIDRKCYRQKHAYDYSHLVCLLKSALIMVIYVKFMVYIEIAC